jgi:hypothetical protein
VIVQPALGADGDIHRVAGNDERRQVDPCDLLAPIEAETPRLANIRIFGLRLNANGLANIGQDSHYLLTRYDDTRNLADPPLLGSCPSEKKDVDQQPCTVFLTGFSGYLNEHKRGFESVQE